MSKNSKMYGLQKGDNKDNSKTPKKGQAKKTNKDQTPEQRGVSKSANKSTNQKAEENKVPTKKKPTNLEADDQSQIAISNYQDGSKRYIASNKSIDSTKKPASQT
jgi:hypothetical protein